MFTIDLLIPDVSTQITATYAIPSFLSTFSLRSFEQHHLGVEVWFVEEGDGESISVSQVDDPMHGGGVQPAGPFFPHGTNVDNDTTRFGNRGDPLPRRRLGVLDLRKRGEVDGADYRCISM